MALILSDTLKTAFGLCLDFWGTLGGLCMRRLKRRGTIVYYERPRQGALSPAQQAHREKFQRGYEQWRTLTDAQQADWGTVADRFSTRMVGSHLFLRVWWRQETHFLDQAKLHLAIDLVLPGP